MKRGARRWNIPVAARGADRKPDRLYLTEAESTERLNEAAVARLTPFCGA